MFGQGQFCKKSTEISEKFYYLEDTLNSQMKLNFDLKSHHVRMDPPVIDVIVSKVKDIKHNWNLR